MPKIRAKIRTRAKFSGLGHRAVSRYGQCRNRAGTVLARLGPGRRGVATKKIDNPYAMVFDNNCGIIGYEWDKNGIRMR